MGRVEGSPGAGHYEGGDGEDGAGGYRLTYGARCARDVFFEDRSFEDAEEGHADYGGWISGGDGLSGVQAEVGVGGSQDH